MQDGIRKNLFKIRHLHLSLLLVGPLWFTQQSLADCRSLFLNVNRSQSANEHAVSEKPQTIESAADELVTLHLKSLEAKDAAMDVKIRALFENGFNELAEKIDRPNAKAALKAALERASRTRADESRRHEKTQAEERKGLEFPIDLEPAGEVLGTARQRLNTGDIVFISGDSTKILAFDSSAKGYLESDHNVDQNGLYRWTFSASASHLIAVLGRVSGGDILVRDLRSGRKFSPLPNVSTARFALNKFKGEIPRTFAVSSTGKYVFSVDGNGRLHRLETATGQISAQRKNRIRELRYGISRASVFIHIEARDDGAAVLWRADGRRVEFNDRLEEISVTDLKTEFGLEFNRLTYVSPSPDGKQVALVFDNVNGAVALDLATKKKAVVEGESIFGAVWQPDTVSFFSSADQVFRVLSRDFDAKAVVEMKSEIYKTLPQWYEHGRHAANLSLKSGEPTIEVHDLNAVRTTGIRFQPMIDLLRSQEIYLDFDEVRSRGSKVQIAADGSLAAVVFFDHAWASHLAIFDTQTKELGAHIKVKEMPRDVFFSPQADHVALIYENHAEVLKLRRKAN